MDYQTYLKMVQPWMLNNGVFRGPNDGVNYMAEGMTPQQFYDYQLMRYEAAKANSSEYGFGKGATTPSLDAELDPSWRAGAVSTAHGALGNWGVPLAMLTAAFGGGALLGGSSGAAAGTAAAGEGATAGLGTGALDWAGMNAADAEVLAGLGSNAGYEAIGDAALSGGTQALSASDWASMNAADQAALQSAGITTGTTVPAGMNTSDLVSLAKQYGPSALKMLGLVGAAAAAGGAKGSGGSTGGIDALMGHAFGNTQSMLDDYNNVFKPWATNQVGLITDRGNAGYDQLMGMAGRDPNVDAYQEYVNRIGSQGYRDQQRGKAMADVQQQSDSQLGQAERGMTRHGVNPADGAWADLQRQNAMTTAANKVGAAMKAETGAWDQWGDAVKTAAGLNTQDSNRRSGLITAANGLGQSGFNAGVKLAGADAVYRGGITNSLSNLAGVQTSANKVANDQSQYDQSHSLGGLITGGLVDAGGKWLKDNGADWLSKNVFNT